MFIVIQALSEDSFIWVTPASFWPSLGLQVWQVKLSICILGHWGLVWEGFCFAWFHKVQEFTYQLEDKWTQYYFSLFSTYFQTSLLLDWLLPVPLISSFCQTKSRWDLLLKFYWGPVGVFHSWKGRESPCTVPPCRRCDLSHRVVKLHSCSPPHTGAPNGALHEMR